MKCGKVAQSVLVGAVMAVVVVWSGSLAKGPVDCAKSACPPIIMSDAALRSLIKG